MGNCAYDGGREQLLEMRDLIVASEAAGSPLGWQCALLENWRYADTENGPEFFRRNARLWRGNDGRLCGFAVSYRGTNRIGIHALPADAGQLLPEMLAWVENQWAADQPEVFVNCYRHDLAKRQALTDAGFGAAEAVTCTYRFDLALRRPQYALPEGYRFASVREHGDIDGIIQLERAVFATDSLDRRWYAAKSSAPGYSPDLHLHIVAPSGQLAAFAHGWPQISGGRGEIDPVGTHPDHRRRGLAAAVVTACLDRMRDLGISRVFVATETEPYAANRLYESLWPAAKFYEDRWSKRLT